MFRRIFAAFLLVLCLSHAALAQSASSATAPDYSEWETVASQAEASIDSGEDTNEELESLREQLVTFRSEFDQARKANADRISTLRAQIAALGEAPEDGDEPTDITARRAELNRQLSELLAPVQTAEEAYTRADGLIGEIDDIIRERQTERLLSLGPSPLNPVLWPGTLKDLGEAVSDVATEARVLQDEDKLAAAQEQLPLVLLLMAVATILLARGRRWSTRLGNYLRQFGGAGSGVWSFVISLLRIALPLAGIYALKEALTATGLVGTRGTAILDVLPEMAFVVLGHRWLAEQLFSRNEDDALIQLPQERRTEARFYVNVIALLVVLWGLMDLMFQISEFDRSSEAVIQFPLLVVLGLILYRFGHILRSYRLEAGDDEEEADTGPGSGQGLARLVRIGGLSAQVAAVVSPVMAAIGYGSVSSALLFPMIATLGVLGFVVTLQRFFSDVYGLITGQGQAARDSLVAVLMGLALVVIAAPLLALIWGARVADLTELWTAFLGGFTVGETTISPIDFVTFAVLFAAGYLLTRLLQNALKTSVLPKTRIDTGAQNALVSGLGYVGIFLAAVIAITAAGIDLSSLALVAGALSVGIGFGLQNIVSNFVSGIILLIERPISEGDWIEVGGQHGTVSKISVRSTRIQTFDRSDVIVPNADLVSGTVTNYTRGNTVGRIILPVGVAYGTDTRRVESILREIAEAHPMVLLNPAPSIIFTAFGASSLDFEVRVILRDIGFGLGVRTELNHQIAERFAKEGIEIPFPQQDLWLRNAEALRGENTPQDAPEEAPPTGAQPQPSEDVREFHPDSAGPGEDSDK
nr:DUF3772 domain-containing protein [Aliishimia ponticola]